MSSVISGVERITPALAAKYLATNVGHQRNVTMSHVTHLRQQMEASQWKMTGEPIIFDADGMLSDGQHRLLALVAAKVTLEFMVVRGVPSDSFVAMNRGKSRSSGNVFAIRGIKNSNNMAACVSGVLNYRRAMEVQGKGGAHGSLNSYIRASTESMIAEYDAHTDEYESAHAISTTCRKVVKPSVPAVVSAIAMIDAKHGVDDVAQFWNSVGNGVNLSDLSPELYLRNRLIENASSKKKLPHFLIVGLAIKAWNLHVLGKDCSLIRFRSGRGSDDGKLTYNEGCPKVL